MYYYKYVKMAYVEHFTIFTWIVSNSSLHLNKTIKKMYQIDENSNLYKKVE